MNAADLICPDEFVQGPEDPKKKQCPRRHHDVACDAPGCGKTIRIHVNGDPGIVPTGWGALTFRAYLHDEVQLDFCPRHLAAVVLPWVALLEATERVACALGVPADDQDSPLVPTPRAIVEEPPEDDSFDDADTAVLWSADPLALADVDDLDDLSVG